ncbi:Uncharacterised protein [Bacteroides uniformis]|jgi:hypothetical protein|uniref:Uncharacterized protein n=1 Tax=Bacteroides uniformis TaxID=820 RepID=A0A174MR76_BACUN|nr:hypothetical protein HMPREF1072_03430 [Bacteroides uniformis CL03T00C23]EIY79444.1 hypothetical protein HMPREF1073_01660 [Bacteroides uniformis CL03T12C37]CDE03913.1 uncharacterized protein BN594_00883 [Bacteroides uniformis CAG:3]CUO34833.1 Uncharacterised protein [Bacteroides uniformis]CUP37816.1 Uncharacterised protein [Bacteroides uniformis]
MEILVSIAFHYFTNHHFSITHVDWCNPKYFFIKQI